MAPQAGTVSEEEGIRSSSIVEFILSFDHNLTYIPSSLATSERVGFI
jgi:hypothetical protein